MSKGILAGEKTWRIISNFWTTVFLIFLVINFFMGGRYGFLEGPLSILYVSVLTLFAGTKEFDRWYEKHEGRHPGEWFVAVWTLLIFCLLVFSILNRGSYKISSEVIANYIAVLSIFALTQKSKRLFQEKKRKIGP